MFKYKEYIETGDYEKALSEIFEAIERDKDNETHYINGALVLSRLGKIEEAERFLQKAISIEQNSFSALYTLGNLYFDNERFSEAKKIYLAAYGLKPEDSDLNFMLAQVFQNLGEATMSVPFFETALKHSPDDVELLFQYGLILCQLEQYESAVKLLNKVTKMTDHADAEYNLGLALYMLTEDKSLAIQHFKRASQLKNDHHLANHALKKFKDLE